MVPRNQKEYLLNVLNDYEDADTNFLVKSLLLGRMNGCIASLLQ